MCEHYCHLMDIIITIPVGEENYLSGKVQGPGLNMGDVHELRKEEMPKVPVMLQAENLPK
jgi:hypothetical protein